MRAGTGALCHVLQKFISAASYFRNSCQVYLNSCERSAETFLWECLVSQVPQGAVKNAPRPPLATKLMSPGGVGWGPFSSSLLC